MRIILRTVFLVLLCSTGAFAESQPPAPTPAKTTTKPEPATSENKQKPGTYKKTAKEHSTMIEISKAPIIQVETADKGEKHRDYSSSEWWLVYLTGFLVAVTAALAVYTGRLYSATVALGEDARNTSNRQATEMGKSLAIAKESADAARKSAESLPMIERAYVFADVGLREVLPEFVKNTIYSDPAFGDTYVGITVVLKNHGKTPAILKKVYGRWIVETNCPQRANTEITLADSVTIPPGIVIASAEPHLIRPDFPAKFPVKQWNQIVVGDVKLFCYGRIEYTDVIGDIQETGFCWEFVPDYKSPRFTLSYSDLNYYTQNGQKL